MDSVLVLLATGLVAHKYVGMRKAQVEPVSQDVQVTQQVSPDVTFTSDAPQDVEVTHPVTHGVPVTLPVTRDVPVTFTPDVQSHPNTSTGTNNTSFAPHSAFIVGSGSTLGSTLGSTSIPGIAETIHRRPDAAQDDGAQNFNEQFFPQDTRATGFSVVQKPWMRAVENAEKPPRTEREVDFPTVQDRQDIHKTDIPSTVRNFENLHTQRTIPRSREKHFQSPVEGIATQNEGGGGLRGQRQLQRYHKFVLNDEPSLEMRSGSKGNFTGANKSSSQSQLDNTKKELVVSHSGVPVAASFKVGMADASFELEGSNAEAWLIDEHTMPAGARGPVEKSTKLVPSFKVAHDDVIESFHVSQNANLARSSRPKPVSTENQSKLKDSAIETQTVLGAPGGNRLEAINKDSKFKSKAKDETLAFQASSIDFKSSSKSAGPGGLVVKQDHAPTDQKLAEVDTSRRVRGVPHQVKRDVGGDSLVLNEAKSSINRREFTSQNVAAPQNTSLPPHLRVAPTSSITATTDMTLKDNAVDTTAQSSTTRGKQAMTSFNNTPSLGEPTKETEGRNLALLTDRMVAGDALKLLANPYSRPGFNRLEIDV